MGLLLKWFGTGQLLPVPQGPLVENHCSSTWPKFNMSSLESYKAAGRCTHARIHIQCIFLSIYPSSHREHAAFSANTSSWALVSNVVKWSRISLSRQTGRSNFSWTEPCMSSRKWMHLFPFFSHMKGVGGCRRCWHHADYPWFMCSCESTTTYAFHSFEHMEFNDVLLLQSQTGKGPVSATITGITCVSPWGFIQTKDT